MDKIQDFKILQDFIVEATLPTSETHVFYGKKDNQKSNNQKKVEGFAAILETEEEKLAEAEEKVKTK